MRRSQALLQWFRPRLWPALWLALWLAGSAAAAPALQRAPQAPPESAVILLYHRFDEAAYPSTNISGEVFAAHLQHFQQGGFHFMTFGAYIRARQAGRPVPPHTLVLTVDDAYQSFADHAWPKLRAAGIPVTLFVATAAVDAGARGIMDWRTIRRLKAEGVEIGHHSHHHWHLNAADPAALEADIASANARFMAELGAVPEVFAYPYGEFSRRVAEQIRDAGFIGAAAQYSAAAGSSPADRFAVPRFALNERYGSLDRLRLMTSVEAVRVADRQPAGPLLDRAPAVPAMQFRLPDADHLPLDRLNCFASFQDGPVALERQPLPDRGERIIVKLTAVPRPGRNRVNCTLPLGGGRWAWIGQPFFVPTGLPPDQGD